MRRNCANISLTALSFLCCVILLFSLFSGCASVKRYWNISSDLIGTSHKAADELLERLSPPLKPNEPVLVASFADIDDLERSSTFGRTVSQFIASRLTNRGIKVIELKMTDSVYIKQSEGEFFLSRNVQKLSKAHAAKIVFAGTYSKGNNMVYISARALDPENGMVLSAYEYDLAIDDNLIKMLSSSEIQD